jgi:CheY-like chemotaxis protein
MSCFTILMAEDHADDRFLAEQAYLEIKNCLDLRFVEDGEELMHYLRRRGKYADPTVSPRPALILLDLKMPFCGMLIAKLQMANVVRPASLFLVFPDNRASPLPEQRIETEYSG